MSRGEGYFFACICVLSCCSLVILVGLGVLLSTILALPLCDLAWILLCFQLGH